MRFDELHNYGAAFSDAESSWPSDVKARMKRRAMDVMLSHIPWSRRLSFLIKMGAARRRARKLDLSDLRARGMTNASFLRQQLEYLAAYAALVEVFGAERALEIMLEVMDASSREPLLLCLPKPEQVQAAGAPIDVMREYFRASPDAARQAACHESELVEEEDGTFELRVHWCVWLELAERMELPEACQPNCYSDDLVFPEYFDALGISYERTQTLACGGTCCDFRFQPKESPA